MRAASNGNSTAVVQLIKAGADLNLQDSVRQYTPKLDIKHACVLYAHGGAEGCALQCIHF